MGNWEEFFRIITLAVLGMVILWLGVSCYCDIVIKPAEAKFKSLEHQIEILLRLAEAAEDQPKKTEKLDYYVKEYKLIVKPKRSFTLTQGEYEAVDPLYEKLQK